MSVLRHTAIAICVAGTAALATEHCAAGALPTRIVALKIAGASDLVEVQWTGRAWSGGLPERGLPERPPVSADLAIRQAERGFYPFTRYPYYLPYYYYSYPRYSSHSYKYEWYYNPFYKYTGRPYP